MYHHAGTYLDDGVVDNVLLASARRDRPHADKRCMQELSLRAGLAPRRSRTTANTSATTSRPAAYRSKLKVQKWNFGIHNTLYAGKDLMPYYVARPVSLDYGPGLYWGEPWYRTRHNIYDRLEIYWQPVHTETHEVARGIGAPLRRQEMGLAAKSAFLGKPRTAPPFQTKTVTRT